ncbi:MAG: thioredoxin fold domain-containing protein [Cytophagales bacterium]|nr:thioredoxin fold domain-containing protein [Cytophagales bacterium]MDW8383251.1 thioredoxin fold domain-containing protein [Flammeovirgaceae bacterium]
MIFWRQELQYLQPTPVPKGFQPNVIDSTFLVSMFKDTTPIFLYFFNPNCPCSRFNQKNFRKIYRTFRERVSFYAIIEKDSKDAISYFEDQNAHILIDSTKVFAHKLGIYSTPQVVILDEKKQIYYRGNFQKSRYCTDKKTDFAFLALDALLQKKPLPNFSNFAFTPYGCSIFEEKDDWFSTGWVFK